MTARRLVATPSRWQRSAGIALLALTAGCSDIGALSDTTGTDTTDADAYSPAATGAPLLSAFYGLDDAIPPLAALLICGGFGLDDGMPVVFSEELDLQTMQAGDFRVTLADGSTRNVDCATPAPAQDTGELRTILLVGDFGGIDNQPTTVEVTGNILSLDHRWNFRDSRVGVTGLEQGPSLILAEVVTEDQWELGKDATRRRFGGGSGCPQGTRQVIRAVWTGGVTKPGGEEVGNMERVAYSVQVAGLAGEVERVTPAALGDLGDGDNNHELCLDTTARALRVAFPAGLMTDPREDLNPATTIAVTH